MVDDGGKGDDGAPKRDEYADFMSDLSSFMKGGSAKPAAAQGPPAAAARAPSSPGEPAKGPKPSALSGPSPAPSPTLRPGPIVPPRTVPRPTPSRAPGPPRPPAAPSLAPASSTGLPSETPGPVATRTTPSAPSPPYDSDSPPDDDQGGATRLYDLSPSEVMRLAQKGDSERPTARPAEGGGHVQVSVPKPPQVPREVEGLPSLPTADSPANPTPIPTPIAPSPVAAAPEPLPDAKTPQARSSGSRLLVGVLGGVILLGGLGLFRWMRSAESPASDVVAPPAPSILRSTSRPSVRVDPSAARATAIPKASSAGTVDASTLDAGID